MKFSQKSPNFIFLYIFLFSLLINSNLSKDCPRDKPILKSDECQAIYCTPEEYSSETCVIANDYIKAQWFNSFHLFDKGHMSHISVSKSSKGELFISSQKEEDDFDKYLFAFNSEGDGLFNDNKTGKLNCFEVIDFAIREYADYNSYVEIDGKGYLIGVPTDDDIYLIDYMNNTIKSFTIRPIAKASDTIFKMNNYYNMFFTAYVFCTDTFGKNCSLHFQLFRLNLTKLERIKNITNIPTIQGARTNCFQNEKAYIFCFYSKKIGEREIEIKEEGEGEEEEEGEIEIVIEPILEHYLSAINPETFQFIDTITIESNYRVTRMFEETIHLKNDLYIIAYAIDDQIIKIQFKNIVINTNLEINPLIYEDFFSNIKEIYINKDKKLDIENGSYKRNSMCKINDNKFAMFIKEYSKDSYKATNSILLIYIFTLFNDDKNINIRRYSIDFELYNKHVNNDIRGYTLGNFFGMVLCLTKDIESSQSGATFLTFGYVNATEQESIDTKLKYNNTKSKIVLSEYINEMENNLFGYDFLGVKIISLPYERDSGYFVNNINNKKIELNDIVPRNSELQFILSDSYLNGIYSIIFAGIVKEPEYETMNEFADELISYPENQKETDISEREFYTPKTILGKKINYQFRLSHCYDSCQQCISFSEDENNHKCISCRDGFYFIEGTNNCYDKIENKYYFDKDKKVFLPCYKDCLSCSGKENSPKEMNCLSCENEFKYYNVSKNCLKCEKYVNFEQNECIDEIPEGYYLEDKELGTLGKCHFLCKTCIEGPFTKNNNLHMNCQVCLYKNSNFKPIYDGDCPDSPDVIDPDAPVDGKCPINKPILKNGKCGLFYCTNENYEKQICTIYNPIVKTQWLNKFHIFSENSNSEVSVANDIISNNKIIFMSQNINKENGYKEKYFYGFHKNGNGLFFDKNKNDFISFKKIDFPENIKLIDKIGYIEMDYDGYLLTTPIENNLYIIDYEDNKIIKKGIDTPAYSTDKIILMEEEDESKDPDYTTSYIYCKDLTNLKECYLMFKNFEADEEELTENSSSKPNIRVHYNSELNCYKDEQNYIRCTYTKYEDDSNYKYVLGLYNTGSFTLRKEFELENNYDIEPTFDSMIRLKNFVNVIAYSTKDNKNIIKILIKTIKNKNDTFYIEDYIPQIPEILLNEDNLYLFEGGKASSNSLVQITIDKFALLVNNFKNDDDYNSQIVIFVFNIYDSNSKINVRHYPINFNLYNTLINRKIIGYNLNGFFGALIELTSPENKDINRPSFFTFGYVNSTSEVSPMEGNEILIVKNEKIKISNYLNTIENNLFGYEFSIINIISIPDEKAAGYFALNKQYSQLKPGDNISKTAEISFYISDKPKTGNYSIVFAPVLEEPKLYSTMNSYSQKIESYPKNEADTESNFYSPITKLGKFFTFNFYIKGGMDCYQNCETCYKESKDVTDQQCIECKKDYYKTYETNNCYYSMSSGYYFDKNKKLFMPCYKDCLSCDDSGTETKMNCLSCDDDKFDYYKKSTNCLDCPKYVDYSQSKCINEIPEGYYVDNEYLGTIEKCHDLCKTCEKKSIVENGQLYMNCKTCKYNNNTLKIKIAGNCPEFEEEQTTDDKKNENQEKKEEDGTNIFVWIFSSIIIIIILVINAIIIYKKCCSKSSDGDRGDYYNLKGKDIGLEDENIEPIND